jgi:geranylgeranyl diphosphate synthase type II
VLDCVATAEELGKPIGSDIENDKSTFASLLGIEACEKMINRETNKAIAVLKENFDNADFLIWLAHVLAERKS